MMFMPVSICVLRGQRTGLSQASHLSDWLFMRIAVADEKVGVFSVDARTIKQFSHVIAGWQMPTILCLFSHRKSCLLLLLAFRDLALASTFFSSLSFFFCRESRGRFQQRERRCVNIF